MLLGVRFLFVRSPNPKNPSPATDLWFRNASFRFGSERSRSLFAEGSGIARFLRWVGVCLLFALGSRPAVHGSPKHLNTLNLKGSRVS